MGRIPGQAKYLLLNYKCDSVLVSSSNGEPEQCDQIGEDFPYLSKEVSKYG